MTTARSLIRKALLDIGALTKTERPAADEANDALDALNALIASWSNFGANIYTRQRETFPLTSAASYTIGSGQTFNTTIPIQIVDAYTTLAQIDYPLSIITDEQYDSITFKANPGIPQVLQYNNNYPIGTILLYPTPVSVTSITILSEKAVTGFATLDTVLSLPNGWERALQKNLALEIAPQYRQQPDPSIVKAAAESLGLIRMAVVRSRPVPQVTVIRQTDSIYNGWLT